MEVQCCSSFSVKLRSSICAVCEACCKDDVPVCLLVGVKRGVCSQINHFPEDADFDHDGPEYVLRKRLSFITTTVFIMTKHFCSINEMQAATANVFALLKKQFTQI